jgi:pimeloyl-ACP methyl ester carboxylesterase
VVLRIAVAALALLVAGCLFYIAVSYSHAFWHRRRTTPVRNLVRAALVELGACMLLLPFWPLWLVIGASYEATHEGDGVARGRRHPVILLHGFAMNRTNWIFLGRRLARRGIGPLYGTSYFSPQSVRRSAQQLARFIEGVRAREQCEQVDIVAHSLGGVVARYYVQRLGGDARVHTLCTLGTPHAGTYAANLFSRGLMLGAVRQLRPGSDLMRELAEPAPGCRTRFVAFWSDLDQLIVPQRSASIDHPDLTVRNVALRGVGHMSLPIHGPVVHEITTLLAHLGEDGSTRTAGVTSIEPATSVVAQEPCPPVPPARQGSQAIAPA